MKINEGGEDGVQGRWVERLGREEGGETTQAVK